MIEIIGLTKRFNSNTLALNNINLHVEKSEFVTLLGPSGAGKSTLLRCINGLEKPTQGNVFVKNKSVVNKRELREIQKKTGMIFQQYNLVKRLNVLQNVLCGRLAYNSVLKTCLKLFTKDDISLALECIDRVGLKDKVYNRADQLSGGQQQRVGIARALAQNPDVILADEPIASLDPVSAERILEILKEININDGITIIVSLHNVQIAQHFADRLIGIRNGEIVFNEKNKKLDAADMELIYEDVNNDRKIDN
jgi:phosphonate transport system ATP-binding protein